MKWKDFLYFRRGSKTAVILLLILIVLTLILNILLSYRDSSAIVVVQNDSIAHAFDEFLRGLKRIDSSSPETSSEPPQEALKGPTRDTRSGTFAYDTSGYNSARPDNVLNPDAPHPDNIPRTDQSSSGAPRYPFTEKLAVGETISLNSSDTAEWKRVPGIGSAYASRIVEYRDRLGGFIRKEQLMEVYRLDSEMYARVAPYIEPGGNWRRVAVNHLEFKELLRHPYLNYKQVAAIMNLRRKKGNITSLQELGMLEEFTQEDIARLEPYLEF